MYRFEKAEMYVVNRRISFSVRNPIECDNFDHLIGDVVVLGEMYRCTAVGKNCHCAPWYQGEGIELMVEDRCAQAVKD